MQVDYIKWIDSYGCSPGWQKIDSLTDGIQMECHSVGVVVDENETYVLLVPHYHGDIKLSDDFHAEASGCGDMAIPKVAILDRVKLMDLNANQGVRNG